MALHSSLGRASLGWFPLGHLNEFPVTGTIFPDTIASAESVSSDLALSTGTITPDTIASAESVSSPVVIAGILPDTIASAEVVSAATISSLVIFPSSIASGEVVSQPSILAIIAPVTIGSAEAFGTPAILGVVVAGAPSGYQLFIANVDRTAYLRQDTLNVRMALNERSTASMQLLDSASGAYRPVVGQPVEFWMGTAKRFAGLIQEIEERNENGTAIFYYSVTCGDYTSILDRRTINFVYDVSYGTLSSIVNDIILRALEGEGLGIGTVSSAVSMVAGDKLEFNGITVKQAFDKLAEFFAVDGYRVDFDKNVQFRNFAAVAAPYNLIEGNGHLLSNTIKVRRSLTDYANRVGLRTSGGIAPLWCDTITGTRSVIPGNVLDGVHQFYVTKFILWKAPRVRVNGVDKIVIESALIKSTATWDWYWLYGGYGVQQNFYHTPLSASDTLEICYPSLFPSILSEQSDTEIAARKAVEGGTGIYEAVVDLADVPSYQTAQKILDGLLARRGTVNTVVEWESHSQGWEPGQSLTINLTKPLVASDTFLLDTVSFSEREGSLRALAPFLWYALKASSGQALGSSSRWFDKVVASMSRAKDRVYEIVSFWINTPLAAGTNITTVAPRGMSDGIAAIVSVTLTDSTGAAITGTVQKTIFDVNRNGVSIFGSTKLEVAVGASSGDQGFFSADPLYVAEGDVYTLDCDQIGTFSGDVYCNVNVKVIRT